MKSICTLFLLLLMGSAFGQNQKDLSIQYHSDGTKTVIDNDGLEIVTLKLNRDGLVTFKEVSIIGSFRVLRSEYVYDHNNRLTETIDYSGSSGYKKSVETYNEQGITTSITRYESADPHKKGNWRIISQLTYQYDAQMRDIRFESKQIPGNSVSSHFHMIIETSYNGDGTRTTFEREFDQSGRVIKSSRGKSQARGPNEPRSENIVKEMRQNGNGFIVTSATENLKNEVYYENNRIVKEKFYRFKSGSGNTMTTKFSEWYTFDYTYQNGKLTEQLAYDKDVLRNKRVIEYQEDKPVRFKRFYKQKNAAMKMVVKQGFTPAHEEYFPKLMSDYRPGDNLSAFGDGTDEPVNEVYENPQSTAYESPSYNHSGTSTGIVRKLETTPKLVLNDASVQLDKETQALLHQIKMLANANSSESFTDAQILHLALQQLVEDHREELKALNQQHLESQQSMFD